jgi:hypothetical protein
MNPFDVWHGELPAHQHASPLSREEINLVAELDWGPGCLFLSHVWWHGRYGPQPVLWPMNVDESLQGMIVRDGKFFGFSTREH